MMDSSPNDVTAEIKDEFKAMRSVEGSLNRAVAIGGFLLGLFHLYTGFFGSFSAMNQRGVHWTVMSVMIFILYPASKASYKRVTLSDYLWGAGAALSGLYILLSWSRIAENAGVTGEIDHRAVLELQHVACSFTEVGDAVVFGVAAAVQRMDHRHAHASRLL